MSSGLIFRFIMNVLIFLLWLWFFSLTMERKLSKPVLALLWVVTFALWWSIAFIPNGSPFRTIIFLFATLLLSFLGFRASVWKHILSCFIVFAVTGITELLILLIYPGQINFADMDASFVTPPAILANILYGIILAFLLWGASLLVNRYKARLTTLQWLSYITVPLSQAFTFTAFCYLSLFGLSGNSWIAIIVCAVFFIAADVLTVSAIRETAKKAELEAENRLLARQINAQTEYYANLTQQYEENRRMRHDIQHHLHTIQILIEQGRHEDASQYAAELMPQHTAQRQLLQCENTVVDAFLSSRIREAERNGTQINAQIALPSELAIQNTDLIIVFGNLLDNAMEACAGVEQPEICIDAHLSKGCLVIHEENPTTIRPTEKQRRIPELERGLGLHILEEMSSKYNGELQYEAADGRFQITLILNIEENVPCLT